VIAANNMPLSLNLFVRGTDDDDDLTVATTTIDPMAERQRFHRIRSGRGGEVKKKVGSGGFQRGRSGDSLALEVAKGSGTIGSIAEKQKW
jgi:hypothetical protein